MLVKADSDWFFEKTQQQLNLKIIIKWLIYNRIAFRCPFWLHKIRQFLYIAFIVWDSYSL